MQQTAPQRDIRWNSTVRATVAASVLGAVVLAGLFITSRHNYLLFHGLAEGFAIVIACGVFMLAWNSRRILDNSCLLWVGIAYLFVGVLDLVHTLAYQGMGVFPTYGPNLATQLWIAARYVEAVTLLVAPFMLAWQPRPRVLLALYISVTALLLAAIFSGWFPDCFVRDQGLTSFKVASEYVISGMLVAAAVLFYRRRAAFDRTVIRLLIASALLTIASEMSFTLYADPYGFFNQLGHFLKLVSFYLIYRAVIVTGLARPYDLLFRQLRESESRYRALFESMAEAFALHEIITDDAGQPCDYRFLDVNPSFERMTALSRDDVVGRRVLELLPGLESHWIVTYGRVALEGTPAHMESYSGVLGRWYEVFAYRPAARQFATVFTDITDRKHAQAALEASRQRLQLLATAAEQLLRADNPPAIVDDICRMVMAQLDCQVFFNYLVETPGASLRLNASGGVSPQTAATIAQPEIGATISGCVARDGNRLLADNIQQDDDPRMQLLKSDGIKAYCCHPLLVQGRIVGTLGFGTRTHPTFSPDDIALMKSVCDQVAVAVQRLQAERALVHANADLEHRVHERTMQLAQTVQTLEREIARRESAEEGLRLRSEQLQALAAELTLAEQRERRRLAEVLHDELQQLLVGAKFRLGRLKRTRDPQVKQVADTVDDLLDEAVDCSRTLTGELSPPILHQAGLAAALGWLAVWMQQKHAFVVELQTDEAAEPQSEEMKVLLFQSTRELLFNAVKHAQVRKAQVCLERPDDHIQLTVTDKGVGFDPGVRKPVGGRPGGFGLFSIQERLDLLGGQLQIHSGPGRGSRFTMRVPDLPAQAHPAVAATTLADVRISSVSAASTPAGPATEAAVRLMLVDDHVVVRQGLSLLLREEPDIKVVAEASDGHTAVEQARRLHPDVILMDINMPDMDGIEATRRIHAESPGIRIIGLSMFAEEEAAARMRQAGAIDYLTKSGPSADLLAAIRRWAADKHADARAGN